MYNNGSVSNTIEYKDICNIDPFVVNFGYVTAPGWFEVVNNTMVEWHDYRCILLDCTKIPFDFEILETFIQNNNIGVVNWIDGHTFFGMDETGNVTGLIGKVINH